MVIGPAETTGIFLVKYFLRNCEIVKQFKNFEQNFSGVIYPAKTISAGLLTPLKFQIVV
jgi:hypothetical protein